MMPWIRKFAALLLAGLVASLLFAAPSAIAADDPAAPSFRDYIDGPYGQIHVRVAGPPDGVPMVLVHKMVWSSVEFEKALPILADMGVRAIAVDLPGYGLSDAPSAEPSAEDYADALVPVLDHFGIGRAVFVGANTGATIAAAFGTAHPDRTLGVAMDGPPLFSEEELKHLLAEPEFDRTARPHGATLLRRWQDIEALANGRLSDEAIQTGLLQFFQAGPDYLWGHQAIFKADLSGMLNRIAVPTLIVTYPGDQLRETALRLAAEHPQFDLVDIPAEGMTADYQNPDLWAASVGGWALALPR